MKVLVIGGAGFLGSVTLQRLQQVGYQTVIFDNFSTGFRQNARGRECIDGDLRETADVRRLFANHRVDVVLYLAGVPSLDGEAPALVADPHARYAAHLGAAMDFVRVLRDYGGVPLVLASTLDVYSGGVVGPVGGREGPEPCPRDVTGRIALAVEHFLLDYLEAGGLPSLILRFGWISGADTRADLGDDRCRPMHWLSRLLRACRFELEDGMATARIVAQDQDGLEEDSGLEVQPRTQRGPEPVFELLHVIDAADALVAAVAAALEGRSGVYHVGTGHPSSTAEILTGFQQLTGSPPPALSPPPMRSLAVDPRPAMKDLGWSPRRSRLDGILRDSLQWRLRFPDGYRSRETLRAGQEATQAQLFGEIAMSLGFVTPDQVVRALEIQQRRLDEGPDHKLIGLIMLEEGMLNNMQFIEVLRRYEDCEEEGITAWKSQN